MIAYVKSDISEGLKYLKIGIGNIIASVAKEEVQEYTLDMSINYHIIVFLLRQLYPEKDLQYSDKYILVNFDDKVVCITFENSSVHFHLWEIIRDSVPKVQY